jgi:hypothetical protein
MFLPGNEAQMNDTSSRRDFVRSLRIVFSQFADRA